MEEKATNKNGLAIASFVLAILGTLFCLSIVCLPLGVICLILAVIFGLIALCKRQKTRASILGILISLGVFIGGWMLGKKLSAPVVDFFNRVRENPAIWDMMSEKDFALKVKDNVTEKLQEKYGDSDDIKFFDVWSEAFEEAKQNILELAEQQGINGNEEPVVGIANPAAEFCVAQGGESYVVEDEDGAQMGMCRLSDGSEVDEWEYYRENANLEPEINPEETPAEATVCDEFYKSGEEIVCTEQYEPVCGDNGQTYGNSCFACIEVDSYTNGECTESTPAPAAKLMVQEGQTEEETQAMIQETCTNAGGQLVDGNCVLKDGSMIAF